jgi:FG-GAP repeat/LVIVD repeat
MKGIFIAGVFILFAGMVQAQNVGIGVPTPTEKLQVAGNIKSDTVKTNVVKITPNAGIGKILTSDATGNANWQANNALAAGNVGFGVWGDCSTNGNISEYNPVSDTLGDYTEFGISVSISGNYAIVGTNRDKEPVRIYQYNGSSWVFMQKITDATGSVGDQFGHSVSISGNYAIVGARYDGVGANVNQGSASIYQLSGGTWVLMNKITYINGAANDQFGTSVSISGNYVIVGTPFDDVAGNVDQGSASIYQLNAGMWAYMQTIAEAAVSPGDHFGFSVSISGNYLIVGANEDDIGANVNQGSATIYRYNGATWVFAQKITDDTGTTTDNFGYSVSISGNYAIIGAIYDDYYNGVVTNIGQGSASIYRFNGITFIKEQKLINTNGAENDHFGCSVSISGNYAFVGAYEDDVNLGLNQGAASIYLSVGNGWGRLQYCTDPLGDNSERFGHSVAIDGIAKRFLVGATGYATSSGKVVFGKVN